MNLFTIDFSRESNVPLYRQLYDYIVSEIQSGRLTVGEKLPGKKGLAAHLHISVSTVETGYALLAQEGYIYSRPRSGYYVSPIDTLIFSPYRSASPVNELRHSPLSQSHHHNYRYDLRTNIVDEKSFPYKTWAKLSRETLINGSHLLKTGDTRGDFELRETLAKYLHEFRGVNCAPHQLVIGAGVEYLLSMVCALLSPARGFAVENPGYIKAAKVLKNSGGELSYIPLDSEGMVPGALRASLADICYLTPSHQFPTGIVTSVGRRYQLLNWASESYRRYIIEDDYSGEFTFFGKPIPAMQGLDNWGKVIYISTFSRILAPSIRIAYMVLPEKLSQMFESKFRSYSSTVSRFEQHTLMQFISGGHLGRHLNRVKNLYRKRRDFLMEKLASLSISEKIKVRGGRTGLHLLVTLDTISDAGKVMDAALEQRIQIQRLSDYYYGNSQEQSTLLFSFAGLDEKDLDDAIYRLFKGL